MKNSNIPLLKHISNFLDYCEIEKGLANNTQENYQRYLNKFICWLKSKKLENIKPHELTSDYVWEYRLYLSRHIDPNTKKTLKKSTQNYYLIALRGFLSYFSIKDIITLPVDKIALPGRIKTKKPLSFSDWNK